MYRVIIVAAVGTLLVTGSLATPSGSRGKCPGVTIEQTSFQRSGSNQESQRNSTQHHGPGRHVMLSAVQENSSSSHNDSGNTRRVTFDGTIGGSNPMNMDNDVDDLILNVGDVISASPDDNTTDPSHDERTDPSPGDDNTEDSIDLDTSVNSGPRNDYTGTRNDDNTGSYNSNGSDDQSCGGSSSSSSGSSEENDGVSDETSENGGRCA